MTPCMLLISNVFLILARHRTFTRKDLTTLLVKIENKRLASVA